MLRRFRELVNWGSNLLRSVVRRLPVVGGLADCGAGEHGEAFKENPTTLIFSLSPLWVGAVVFFLAPANPPVDILAKLTGHGELFLYATSVLAPLFFITLTRTAGDRGHSNRLSHVVLAILIFIVASLAFGLERAGVSLNQHVNAKASYLAFGLSVLLVYLATVYRNRRLVTAAALRTGEADFTSRYAAHREAQ
ncbi:hypothetical protein ACFL6C_05060 [Myxococcota bacterium]